MIGGLVYLIANRPDIMLNVCLYARYQADPKELRLSTVKCIMRYFVGTSHLRLRYLKSNTCTLPRYSDANFAGNRTDRKSTTRGCQFIGHSLVS